MVRQLKRRGIALVACIAATPWSAIMFAAGDTGASGGSLLQSRSVQSLAGPLLASDAGPKTPARFSFRELTRIPLVGQPTVVFVPSTSTSTPTPFAQPMWGPARWHRNSGARAAVILGSVAAITGAAVLIYANRPECRSNPSAAACGYGTKVVGGAVLAGGAVALTVGALSWR